MTDDLIARLRMYEPQYLNRESADALEAQARRIAELEAVFETKWDAEQRAIKAWQEKTGKDMTWPDHAKMVEWLLDELDAARAALGEQK